jgi:NAD(P)-dependent dehydrogenase (short-subunit alcohol dehydrogenase family)
VTEPVAVVTGGGKGIGRAVGLAFARAGADVVLAGRDAGALEAAAADVEALGVSVMSVPTDVTDEHAVATLAAVTLERFGHVDALVANSGIGGPSGPLWELSREAWDETFSVNVTGVFLCARAFLPSMIERGAGSMVVMGSMTGKRPLWGRTPYAASKTALIGLVRTLALESTPHGVQVNLVSPGPAARKPRGAGSRWMRRGRRWSTSCRSDAWWSRMRWQPRS